MTEDKPHCAILGCENEASIQILSTIGVDIDSDDRSMNNFWVCEEHRSIAELVNTAMTEREEPKAN
jgi:hypothetical protein